MTRAALCFCCMLCVFLLCGFACCVRVAVGGTTKSRPEVVAGLSGGGFSNNWPRPSYQDAGVKQYLTVAQNLPPSHVFNATSAGFPDIAAQAVNYAVMCSGYAQRGTGTSASTPTTAGNTWIFP